jgi:hypothetical protein
LREFWNGQSHVKLYDPNLLDCDDSVELLQQLIDSKACVDFTQWIDARLVDDTIARLLCKTKIDKIHFAFDNLKQGKSILAGIQAFLKEYRNYVSAGQIVRNVRVYVLTNFNTKPAEDIYRINQIRQLGVTPYVMIYQKGTESQFLTDLQRWCNNMRLQRSIRFEDYKPRQDGRRVSEVYGKYFEKQVLP